jgi:prophage tail gpP-like protein
VDCSAIHKSGQWARSSLDKIVRDICKPFGIPVVIDAPMGDAFATFSIQEGETAHECIERACRMRAVLPVSDGKGNLVITRAKTGEPVASIIEGENLKYAKADLSMRERYSRYIIKGQNRGSDDDLDTPENHSQPSAVAVDDFVKRYRPLIVMAEDLGANASFKQRAEWERNVRRGRGARATVRVNGWRNAAGALWKANSLVYFYSPTIGADANLLIVSGTFTLDEQMGQMTELNLVGREAFDLLAGVKTSRLKRAIKGKNGAAAASGDGSKRKKDTSDWSNF